MSKHGAQRYGMVRSKHHPDCLKSPKKAYQHTLAGPMPRDFEETLCT